MSTINIRAEQPQDEAFLFELYASTRQEELAAFGWPPEMGHAFLTLQFKASQRRHQTYPAAEFQIVLVDGVNAGRMIIHRTQEDLRLVDIALLPQYRNTGIGTTLMQRLFDESIGSAKPLRLQVLKDNRAERFYRRLGFIKIGETETHLAMEWHGPVPPVNTPSRIEKNI